MDNKTIMNHKPHTLQFSLKHRAPVGTEIRKLLIIWRLLLVLGLVLSMLQEKKVLNFEERNIFDKYKSCFLLL